ncbi:hypothetical protein M3Y99_00459900 [Aphelenchoides fujianensis]|nr:hypothetical protein M3Y99_00459900 [Aphelenchoides fujianensis]
MRRWATTSSCKWARQASLFPRAVTFVLDLSDEEPESVLLAYDAQDGSSYDSSASSTFKKTGEVMQMNGSPYAWRATETFDLGGGLVLSDAPFCLYMDKNGENLDGWAGYLTMKHSPNVSTSFLAFVLKQLNQPIVTFSYDSVSTNVSESAGIMTLGGSAEDRCADDWLRLPSSPPDTRLFNQGS